MWGSLKMSLMGHILRARGQDPLRQVTLEGLADYPRIIPKYRVGRPRLDWIEESYREAYKIIKKDPGVEIDFDNNDHVSLVVETAKSRKPPFATKDKISKHDVFIRIFTTPNEQLDFMKINTYVSEQDREEDELNTIEAQVEDDVTTSREIIEAAPSGAVTVTPSGMTSVTVTPSGMTLVTVTPSGVTNEEPSFSEPSLNTTMKPHPRPQTTANNNSSLFNSFITATESSLPLQKWGYF